MMPNWGPVFWLLVVMAIVSVVFFLERFFELRRAQIDWQDFVDGVINVLKTGNETEALSICDDAAVPVANVVATAIRQRHANARILREAVDSQGRAEANRLDRRLAALSVTGQLAPVVGLLGTLIGFVKTVMMVNAGTLVTRSDLMSGAVSALAAAALGLAIAIPVAAMYTILRLRFNRIVSEMEAAASRIVGYISTAEASR